MNIQPRPEVSQEGRDRGRGPFPFGTLECLFTATQRSVAGPSHGLRLACLPISEYPLTISRDASHFIITLTRIFLYDEQCDLPLPPILQKDCMHSADIAQLGDSEDIYPMKNADRRRTLTGAAVLPWT